MMGGPLDASVIAEMRQKMFARVDGDSNGSIDRAEMKSFGAQMGMDGSKVDEAFGKFDTDGSGAIDAKEHEAMFEKIGEKLKSSFGQMGGSKTGSTSGSKDANDVLMDMMDKIREHSQKQQDGGSMLQQFLSELQRQSASYDPSGAKESSMLPSFFSTSA